MLLKYQNLVIRNAVPEDAPTLCRWWNDGAVMAHAGFPNGLGIDLEEIAQQISSCKEDTFILLVLEADGIPLGEMSYRDKGNGAVAIGIKICEPDKQGKGYGSRYLSMLIDYLFASGYEKIVLDTNQKNVHAQHVYEKLGFRKLRVNRDSWRDQLGILQSSVDYELHREDFVPLTP